MKNSNASYNIRPSGKSMSKLVKMKGLAEQSRDDIEIKVEANGGAAK